MLTTKFAITFNIMDGNYTKFNSPPQPIQQTTQFTQEFGGTILLPAATVDQAFSTENIFYTQMLFLLCDQEIQIKLVPVGGSLGATPALTLLSNIPSLLAVKNIQAIYLSNPTANLATLTLKGAGTAGP